MPFSIGPSADSTIWIPMPCRTWRMEIIAAEYIESRREGFKDSARFVLQLTAPEKAKLLGMVPPAPAGYSQSDQARYWASATTNGLKGSGAYIPTGLAEFLSVLYGSEQYQEVSDWLKIGCCWPGADDESLTVEEQTEALQVFVGLECFVAIRPYVPDKDGNPRVRAESPSPVGAIAPDPAYEAFGRRKFDGLLAISGPPKPRGRPVPLPAQPLYSSTGEPLQPVAGQGATAILPPAGAVAAVGYASLPPDADPRVIEVVQQHADALDQAMDTAAYDLARRMMMADWELVSPTQQGVLRHAQTNALRRLSRDPAPAAPQRTLEDLGL